MRFVLIADTFPPLRTSGAVQLRDLSREFARQGHQLTVMLPTADLESPWRLETAQGVQVLRLRAPRTKDIGYVRRTIGEFLMPFAMMHNLRRSPFAEQCWDGVIWYAPSIFFGPIARALKKRSRCGAYLIVRDIFPQWAVDTGLMRRGLPYLFFKAIERYQYSVADVIGVQTAGNAPYFKCWSEESGRRIEVLQNWLADSPVVPCSIKVSDTVLGGRKIFVYAGNMGVAQGMDALIDLAKRLQARDDVGFLFVGRGSDAARLSALAQRLGLSNILFHDEIAPEEIPGLYAQCHVGMIALDTRHRTHNIPGKFLTYMQAGLPVLAAINPGNDLAGLIEEEGVGKVSVSGVSETLVSLASELLATLECDPDLYRRCRSLYARMFSPTTAVDQITRALVALDAQPVGSRQPSTP